MASSLLNEPLPNFTIREDEVPFSRGSERYRERDLQARAYYLERAANGDAEARLLCRTFLNLSGWYNRDLGGDVIGELSKVAKEREDAVKPYHTQEE